MATPTKKKSGATPARGVVKAAKKSAPAVAKAASKLKAPPRKPASKPVTKSVAKSTDRTRATKRVAAPAQPLPAPSPTVARALMAFDDDDVLPSGGSGVGIGFGRCGGRMLSSKVERQLCDLLSREGVAHSHSPRHFEIKLADDTMAAYAPMIVVRGRGREGKTIVIEALDQIEPALLEKVRAFRKHYGLEFYVSFVGSEELLDEVPVDAYDESTVVQNVSALVSRLAD
jgi:hypothetical protein